MRKDKNILYLKYIRRSIMILVFLYSYYKLMQLSDKQSQVNPYIKYKKTFIL